MLYNLVLHELGHVIVYTCFVVPLYFTIKDKLTYLKYFITGLLVTMLMDLDHFIDYFIQYGGEFSVISFLAGKYFLDTGKVYVLAHAWEYIPVLLIILFFIKNKRIRYLFLFIIIGLTAHMFWDTVYYGFTWDFYFLYKRAIVGFNVI